MHLYQKKRKVLNQCSQFLPQEIKKKKRENKNKNKKQVTKARDEIKRKQNNRESDMKILFFEKIAKIDKPLA